MHRRYAIVRVAEGHTVIVPEVDWNGDTETLEGWVVTEGLDAEEVDATNP